MNHTQQERIAEKFFEECLDILTSKAHDYASDKDVFSNFKKIGMMVDIPVEKVFLQFMSVKLARLVELMDKEAKHESVYDSLRDLANYACLMALYLNSKEGV